MGWENGDEHGDVLCRLWLVNLQDETPYRAHRQCWLDGWMAGCILKVYHPLSLILLVAHTPTCQSSGYLYTGTLFLGSRGGC